MVISMSRNQSHIGKDDYLATKLIALISESFLSGPPSPLATAILYASLLAYG